MDKIILLLLLSIGSFMISLCNGQADELHKDLVKLHPPSVVKLVAAGPDDIYIYWEPPNNYEVHSPVSLNSSFVDHIHTERGGGFSDSGRWLSKLTKLTKFGKTADLFHKLSKSVNDLISNDKHAIPSVPLTPKLPSYKNHQSNTEKEAKLHSANETANVQQPDINNNITTMKNGTHENTTGKPGVHEELVHGKALVGDYEKPSGVHEEIVHDKALVGKHDNGTNKNSMYGVLKQLHKLVINTTSPPLSWRNKIVVPNHLARVLMYTVFWQEKLASGKLGKMQNKLFNPSKLEYLITDLTPSTTYVVRVGVTYTAETTLWSKNLTVKTKPASNLYNFTCSCNPMGIKDGNENCNMNNFGLFKQLCTCKREYTGLYCQHCAKGYYRIAPTTPCIKCPCHPISSTESCHFEEGYLFCDTCRKGYTGNFCQTCGLGYYRKYHAEVCAPCHCHGNTRLCEAGSGRCIGCRYNTHGFSCERCLRGYSGNAKIKGNCTSSAMLNQAKQKSSHPNYGLIAGILIGVLVAICGVFGFILYRRYHTAGYPRPFWTVELKDDRQGVSFNTVPEDELEALDNGEDAGFYEKQGGKRNRGGDQQYAHLRENI